MSWKPTYDLFLLLVVVGWVGAVFGPATTHDLVAWDDPVYIVFNPVVERWAEAPLWQRLLTPNLGYPMALPVAIYAFASTLGPVVAPSAIHLASLFAHCLNAILVAFLAGRWLRERTWGIAVAALWALHPLTVESVAWAANLKEPLMVLGVLLGLLGWERTVASGRSYALGLVAFGAILGLASKPTAALLGPLILCRIVVGKQRPGAFNVTFALAITAIGFGWLIYSSGVHATLLSGQEASFATRDYWATIFSAIGLQAHNYVVLGSNEPYYPIDVSIWSAWSTVGSLALVLWVAGVVHGLVKGHRLQVWLLVAMAVAHAPYSNLVPLPRITADTYLYLASVFLATLIVAGVRAVSIHVERKCVRYGSVIAIIAVSIALAAFSVSQLKRWKNTETLFGPLLGEPAHFSLPYGLVAYEYWLTGRNAEAVELLDQAWPHLRERRALPGFAWESYLEAGRAERAADALVRVNAFRGQRAVASASTRFRELGLPLPETPEGRETLRSAVEAHPELVSDDSVSYLKAVGLWSPTVRP